MCTGKSTKLKIFELHIFPQTAFVEHQNTRIVLISDFQSTDTSPWQLVGLLFLISLLLPELFVIVSHVPLPPMGG